MGDAHRLHELREAVAGLRTADAALTGVLALAAGVRPRPGAEDATRGALAGRARAVLDGLDPALLD
jgi:hypothetical protein